MAAGRNHERVLTALLRVLVVLLVLPLVTAGTLPFWAQLVGIERPHVCHCSVEKHDCVCPKCHPDHEDEMLLTSASLTGRCGDDELAFSGKKLCAVRPASGALLPVFFRTPIEPASPRILSDLARPPPTPPPRSFTSAVWA